MLPQVLQEGANIVIIACEDSNQGPLVRLLRTYDEGAHQRTAEERDEVPPPHLTPLQPRIRRETPVLSAHRIGLLPLCRELQ